MSKQEIGELSVWDRLEGIPDPIENLHLSGHRQTLDRLAASYASGRMHHAWLLSGPKGIGKATLAARFAGHVFRHPDPLQAPAAYIVPAPGDETEAGVATGAHPNLLFMRRPWNEDKKRFRSELTVNEIRRTISFFGSTAGRGGWRVAIVDPADDLNTNAANALLKALEEPPPSTLFLVLAHSPRGLLATIRSRCQKLAIRALEEAEVIEALDRLGVTDGVEPSGIRLAASLSGGSVRRAIVILREDGVGLYRQFVALLADAANPDWTAIHGLAGQLLGAAAEDRYRLFLDLAHDVISRRIRGEPEPGGANAGAAGAASGPNRLPALARWVEVWEKTRHSAALADEYNLDRKQVILNLFEALRAAA